MGLRFRLLQSVVIAAAVSSGALARPAQGPDDSRTQISVRLADLRLETAAGRQVAHARLQRAAEQVCGPAPSHLADLERVSEFETCRRKALSDAERSLFETEAGRQTARAATVNR